MERRLFENNSKGERKLYIPTRGSSEKKRKEREKRKGKRKEKESA
jgi:hypothetical protein